MMLTIVRRGLADLSFMGIEVEVKFEVKVDLRSGLGGSIILVMVFGPEMTGGEVSFVLDDLGGGFGLSRFLCKGCVTNSGARGIKESLSSSSFPPSKELLAESPRDRKVLAFEVTPGGGGTDLRLFIGDEVGEGVAEWRSVPSLSRPLSLLCPSFVVLPLTLFLLLSLLLLSISFCRLCRMEVEALESRLP